MGISHRDRVGRACVRGGRIGSVACVVTRVLLQPLVICWESKP